MEPTIKDQLPRSLWGLVDEIETAAGSEIAVVPAPEILRGEISTTPIALVAANGASLFEAQISFDSGAETIAIKCGVDLAYAYAQHPIPYSSICHELLHLRRYLVEQVPAVQDITARDPGCGTFTTYGLENNLEHLVIERQLKDYGFAFPLDLCSAADWNAISPRRESARFKPVRLQAMVLWLITCFLTTNVGVRKRAKSFMDKLRLTAEAYALSDRVGQLLESPDPRRAKEGMVEAVCSACGFLPAEVAMIYRLGPGDYQRRRNSAEFRWEMEGDQA